jgi:hypothetical protein
MANLEKLEISVDLRYLAPESRETVAKLLIRRMVVGSADLHEETDTVKLFYKKEDGEEEIKEMKAIDFAK